MKHALLKALRLLLALSVTVPSPLWANPSGGQVAAGIADILNQGGQTVTIRQASNLAVINWHDFSIQAGELTRFIQPSQLAAVLNRVTGGDPSAIYGALQANGRVFLVNPNGVLVGASGVVNAQSFTASTLDARDGEFMAGGDLHFFGASLNSVRNAGTINALGGDVYLIAHQVENSGRISAPTGTVGLAAGSEVLLKAAGDEHVFVEAGGAAADKGVDQQGQIDAAAAELKAARGNVYGLAVNNGGSVHATGQIDRDGHVYLTAEGGMVSNSGELTAKRGDKGGEVKVVGGDIALKSGSKIDVSGPAGGGTALIGGDEHGANPDVPNAKTTTVEKGAVINADALTSGDGGKVVVWSDNRTDFEGDISARGGAQTGNGGFAEVSGKKNLTYKGLADLRAPHGDAGTLLLDPENIDIIAAGTGDPSFTCTGTTPCTFTSDDSIPPLTHLDVGVLETALGSGNVLVQTGGTAGDGDIEVKAPISWSSAYGLTLMASRDIMLDSGASITNAGTGGLSLQACTADLGWISLQAPIHLNGGAFSAAARGDISVASNITAGTVRVEAGTDGSGDLVFPAFFFTVDAASQYYSAGNGVGSATANLVTMEPTFRNGGSRLTSFTFKQDGNVADGDIPLEIQFSGGVPSRYEIESGVGIDLKIASKVAGSDLHLRSTLNPITIEDDLTLTALTAEGPQISLKANVNTGTGNQTYNGAVLLSGGAKTLTAGTVEFDGTVNGSADNSGLTVTGAATLNGASVNTGTGDQSYSGTVTVGVNTTLTGKNLTLAGVAFPAARSLTLTNNGGVATLNGTVNGVDTLTANGTGAGTSLAVNGLISGNWLDDREATTLAGGSVITSHDQNYSAAVTLGAPTTLVGTNLTLAGVVGATNGLTLTNHNNGVATLNGAVTDVGTLTANGDAGTSLAVNSTISAGSVIDQAATTLNGASVDTGAGNQTYSGAVTLGANETLTGGSIDFTSTVDGNYDLVVNKGAGTVTFEGAVGSSGSGLASVTVDALGSTVLAGGSVRTSGTQTYGGPVTLKGGAQALTASGVTFDGTVAENSGEDNSLTVNGTTRLYGASVNTGTGGQTYNGAFNFYQPEVLTGGNIDFQGTVNGDALTVHKGAGTVTFEGAVGSSGQLYSLTVDAGGHTVLQGGSVDTFTDQNYNGPVTLKSREQDLNGAHVNFGDTVGENASENNNLVINGVAGLNGPSVDTGTGSQTYVHAVTLGHAETLTSPSIEFLSTVDGGYGLTVNKGSGSLKFDGAVGASGSGLASITVDAGSGAAFLQGGSVRTSGDQTYGSVVLLQNADETLTGAHVIFGNDVHSASYGLTVNGATSLNGSVVNTGTGAQIYNGAVTLGNAQTLTGPAVDFKSTVDGNYPLIVDKGAGTATFEGAVGGSGSGLLVLIVDALGDTVLQGGSVRTSDFQTYNGPVTLKTRDQALTAGTQVTFGGTIGEYSTQNNSLTVNGTTNVNGASVNTGTGGQTYNGTVTLGQAEALTGGSIDFKHGVGSGYGLSVTKGAGTLTFEEAATAASVTVDALGQTILQGGSVNTSGDQNYCGPVILKNQGQTLTGAHVNFGGTVGENASENNSLFVVGPAGLGASVNTGSGNQSYNGTVTLSGNATLTGAALTLPAVTGGGHDLTLTNSGAATLNGAVSGVGALAANGGAGSTLVVNSTIGATSLSDDEVTTLNNGAVTTTGAQTYGKAVTLGHDATLDSSAGNGDITFSNTVEGAYALVVNAGTGHATFGGPVGDVTPLGSLAVTAGGGINLNGNVVNGNVIDTTGHGAYTGSQTYTGPVLLGADTTLTASKGTLASPTAADGAITFAGKVEAAANADGGGANYGLTTYSDGATTFSGKVGDSGAPLWVEAHITGGDAVNDVIKLNGGEVDTGQFQEYDGNVVIGDNTTLDGGVIVTFDHAVDSPGHYDLTELGSIAAEFDGPVGVGSALGKLSVGAGDIYLDGGTVKTVNDQDYSGSYINLGGASDAHFISTSGSIDFENIIGADTGLGLNVSAANDITFGKTVGFAHGMGPVPAPLGFLTAAASTIHINGGAVNTHSSSATGNDNGNQTYSGPVTLGAAAVLNSSGRDITFSDTVNGATYGLTVNKGAGTATFEGVVGGGAGLGSLTVDALGATVLQGGAITTTGDQTYNGPVTLKTVNQTLTGAHVDFGGTVAENASENNALRVNGLIGLNGASVNTGSGAQTYNGALTLGANETLSGSGIDFKGTVDADSAARTLRVTDAGATTFEAAVGGANAHLSWLNVPSAGGTTLGGNVTTTGTQTYQSPVTLSGNATLTGTAVTLGAVTGGGHNLTLTNSGAATLNDAVSGVGALTANGAGGLTTYSTLSAASVSDGELTALGGNVTTAGGDQSYMNTVALTADTTLTAATIELAAVTGNTKNLTLTNSGAATLSGAVSGVGALRANGTGTLAVNNTISAASLNDAEATTLTGTGGAASVTTTGDQNYGGAATLGANTTLTASTLELAAVTGAGHGLTLTNNGAATLSGAVDGAGAFAANGAGTLATSASISAASVTDGEATTLGAAVTTTGDQSYTQAVTLGANVALAYGNLQLAAVTGGGHDLTLTGGDATTFNGAMSGVGTLTANGIDSTGALTSGGAVTWSAALGAANVNIYGTDLTMNGDITTTGAGGVRLYATGKFTDAASQITTPGGGRFVIWSRDWAADDLGPLTGTKQDNATYADWLLPAFTGNGFLFKTPAPALSDYTSFWNNNVTHPWSPPSPLSLDGDQGSGGSGGGGGAGGSGGSSGSDRDDTEDN